MLFKTPTIEDQFRSAALHPKVKAILHYLDLLADMDPAHQPGTITVTDLISTFRAGPSCHPYGAAADVRTVDWSPAYRAAVQAGMSVVRALDAKVHFKFEDDPGDSAGFTAPHLHIQYGMAADYGGGK